MANLNVKNVKVSNGVYRMPWGNPKALHFNERVLLETHQINSTGGWVVNDWANSGYDSLYYRFDVELIDFLPVTDSSNLMLETYWSNAPTTANSTVGLIFAGREMQASESSNTSGALNGTGTSAVRLITLIGNEEQSSINGTVTIYNPFQTSNLKQIMTNVIGWDATSGYKAYDHVGIIYENSTTLDLDGLGFFAETAPTKIFDDGYINLYGYPIGG